MSEILCEQSELIAGTIDYLQNTYPLKVRNQINELLNNVFKPVMMKDLVNYNMNLNRLGNQ